MDVTDCLNILNSYKKYFQQLFKIFRNGCLPLKCYAHYFKIDCILIMFRIYLENIHIFFFVTFSILSKMGYNYIKKTNTKSYKNKKI